MAEIGEFEKFITGNINSLCEKHWINPKLAYESLTVDRLPQEGELTPLLRA
jgi:hypothetical protein